MTPDLAPEILNPASPCVLGTLGLAGKKSRAVASPSSKTRVDPPHEPSDLTPEPERDEPTPEVEPVLDEGVSEQLHLQADQLAAHLSSRQKELDHREAELNSRAAQLESGVRSARLWIIETESELDSREKAIAEREREAEKRLARLAAAENAIQKRASPSDAEDSPAEDVTTLVDYFATEHRKAMAELDEKRQVLERRARRVDQCQAAFQKLRDEVEQTHREALEIRLGTEELWAELSGAAPPAALTRSLGRIRAKLAEQYRQANAELEERKKEIESLRGQMAEEYRNLAEHKQRFEQWYAGRQEELDQQATRLIAREKQLQKT
jgi:hypothetical protein